MEQSELKVGQWVEYTGGYNADQRGRIKHFNSDWVFVVYKCDNDWYNFQDYTAARTNRDYLTLIEEPEDVSDCIRHG